MHPDKSQSNGVPGLQASPGRHRGGGRHRPGLQRQETVGPGNGAQPESRHDIFHKIDARTRHYRVRPLIAKTALGDPLRARAGRWLHQMAAGFRDNALSYLLVLRLIPLLPFFVVNLVPAFLGVPLSTFVIGTGIGIIPGAFVYATVGAGIGNIFDAGDEFSVKGILTPHLLLALIGLAVLALVPVLYKKLKARTA